MFGIGVFSLARGPQAESELRLVSSWSSPCVPMGFLQVLCVTCELPVRLHDGDRLMVDLQMQKKTFLHSANEVSVR